MREFKEMVKALHAAGIEVILDVVYNHTCEGNHLGPTLSLRGLDNADATTGSTPNDRALLPATSPAAATASTLRHPQALQLMLDSLRYWVSEMHVDGFRFDLATDARARGRRRLRPRRAVLPDHRTRTRCSRA